ncbi:hypothetical protein U1Q18_004901 [Sarracenia purpurea var. burkii]
MASPDPNITHQVIPEAKDNPLSDNNIQDSSVSSSTKVVDDVIEDSAMARFRILKRRDENSKYVSRERRQPTEVVGNGFASGRNNWHQPENGSFDANVGTYNQDFSINDIIDRVSSFVGQPDSMKDFGFCPTDEETTQSHRNTWLGSQLPSGWYDGSSLDWEHVLKGDSACQK